MKANQILFQVALTATTSLLSINDVNQPEPIVAKVFFQVTADQ